MHVEAATVSAKMKSIPFLSIGYRKAESRVKVSEVSGEKVVPFRQDETRPGGFVAPIVLKFRDGSDQPYPVRPRSTSNLLT